MLGIVVVAAEGVTLGKTDNAEEVSHETTTTTTKIIVIIVVVVVVAVVVVVILSSSSSLAPCCRSQISYVYRSKNGPF